MKITYTLLNLFVLSGPVFYSFEKRINFFKHWPSAFAAILITALPFIVWDALFTHYGVWSFSDLYTVGLKLLGLPLEEIAFFFCVPFALLFIYEIVVTLIADFPLLSSWANRGRLLPSLLSVLLPALCLLILGVHLTTSGWWYTGLTLALSGVLLPLVVILTPPLPFMVAFVLQLPGFLLINGVLTGLPVVMYNPQRLSGLKLGTIPLEDLSYCFVLFATNVLLYERFRSRSKNLG